MDPHIPQEPVAANDMTGTNEDNAVTYSVLANDTDPDTNITGSVTLVANATNGAAVVNPDNTITYTPNPDFNGTDVVVYEVCDEDGLCDTASMTITVAPINDTPIAVDDVFSTPFDTAITMSLLDNDSDVDVDTLSVS